MLLLSLRCVDPGPLAGHTMAPGQAAHNNSMCCRLLTWLPLCPRLMLPAQLQALAYTNALPSCIGCCRRV